MATRTTIGLNDEPGQTHDSRQDINYKDAGSDVELTEFSVAVENPGHSSDSPDSDWKLNEFQDSYDVVQSDPTGEAIADCDKYVLRYYRILLKLLGWINLTRHPGVPLRVVRWVYVILLSLMIFITFGIQIAICYQRDGFRIQIVPSRDNITECKADEHVIITLVLDLLLIGSYWFGIYLFSGQGDSEHLFSLVSRTVVKYYELDERNRVGTIRRTITLYLLAALVWIALSFCARLLQAFGLGLFPAEYTLMVHWGDHYVVPTQVQIGLGVVCLFGFVLFDLVYLAAVVNYSMQSEFNIKFVQAICKLVVQKKYSKLDLAIKDIGEAKSYLDLLNGRTAFIVAMVLFNFGSGAIAGLIDLHSLSESDIVTPFSLGLALTAVGLGTLLWLVLAFTPFIQASRQVMATFPHFGTDAIHAGQDHNQWKSKAVIPGIFLSTTYKQDTPGKPTPYEYTRAGNPTRTVVESCIAALENAKHGFVASSGLAATSMVLQMLSSGDHIVSVNDVYGGTNRFFRKILSQCNIDSTFVDATKPQNVQEAMKENTKVVWIESCTNPTLQVIDVKAVADIVHKQKDTILVVDNTFMTPYFLRPLDIGADVVLHSVTKYLNGHTDVLMGALCTNNEDIAKKLNFFQLAVGAVPSPFDCYLVNRGIKTLHLRMRQHEKNAMEVAKFLDASPHVEKVIYPGHPSHPQHELAKRQCKGFGGMVSFVIKGDLSTATAFTKKIKIFLLAESLGGYESLAEIPSVMTHASVSAEERAQLGIKDTLIRLSVGLEDVEDLIEDVRQALDAACTA